MCGPKLEQPLGCEQARQEQKGSDLLLKTNDDHFGAPGCSKGSVQ